MIPLSDLMWKYLEYIEDYGRILRERRDSRYLEYPYQVSFETMALCNATCEYKRDLFYGVYYGSRLSWILPGFLVHSIFSPVVANCVLHLLVQSTACHCSSPCVGLPRSVLRS